MANNPYVNKVQLADGTSLIDISDTTATASDVANSKYIYMADGSKVQGSITSRSSSDLTASGATVTVPSGYYSAQASKSVASGTAGTPTATKVVDTDDASALITPSVTNTTGYITGGTKTGTSFYVTARELVSGHTLTCDEAGNWDVAELETFVVPSGTAGTPTATKGTVSNHQVSVTPSVTNTTGYITGGTKNGTAVTVSASELVSGTYTVDSSGTKDVTNYASASVPAGTAGTPSASKGTVSNHSVSVTPSVTNTTGWITGSTKTGTAVTVTASELASGNKAITQNGTDIDVVGYSTVSVDVQGGGGGSATKKQINFIDYDGTIVESYTKTEWQSVTALPSNPSHTGLAAQGWNWTKAQIDAQLTAMPDGDVWVGQMYITSSGDTEIDIILSDGRLSPSVGICPNGTVEIDWGDGSAKSTVTGTSLSNAVYTAHTYTAAGSFTIKLHVVSGSFKITGSSSSSTGSRLLWTGSTGSTNGNRAYQNAIKAVRLGSGITSFGTRAFQYCYSLVSISIPSSITDIGTYAFEYCTSLSSITIPSGITSIESYTFGYEYSRSSISIPSSITSIGTYVFQYGYSCSSITIPSGVTSIGVYAFNYCYALVSIVIPSGVTSIGTSMFHSCNSLSSITIPSNVASIGSDAFGSCPSLAKMTFLPTSPPTASNRSAFSSYPADRVVYVPSGKLATYQGATNYTNITNQMVEMS